MIYIVDAIMGSGKTSATYTFIRQHIQEKRFLYITPFQKELTRFKKACAGLNFAVLVDEDEKKPAPKMKWLQEAVKAGRNIATTHANYLNLTNETFEMIREKNYTLICDECLDSIHTDSIATPDYIWLNNSGFFVEENGICTGVKENIDTYVKIKNGEHYKFLKRLANREYTITTVENREESSTIYMAWVYSPETLNAFTDVIVLTYQIEGQFFGMMLRLYNVEYQNLYIHKDGEQYSFTKDYALRNKPKYLANLKDLIHIFQNEKLNDFPRTALSENWYKEPENVNKMKNNLFNYFTHYNIHDDEDPERDVGVKTRAWSCYKKNRLSLQGNGFKTAYINFNERATNKYKDRTILAYPLNIYMPVNPKKFLSLKGLTVTAADEEAYALSILTQWLWRSAIRDGHEIWLYLPSTRMRNILEKWIDEVSTEYYEMEEGA